jgi:hypothetical protein
MLDNNFALAVVHSKYPHVGHLIKTHWDEPDFCAVMDDLLNPDPRRQGFPSGVFNALRSLALMHEMEATYYAREGEQAEGIACPPRTAG